MTPDDGTTDDAAGAARTAATERGGVERGATQRGAVERQGARGDAVEGLVALPHDPKAIEDLIAQRRASLEATIDELVVRAHPKEIVRRSAAGAKGRLQAFATTPNGALRTERLVAVGGAAVAFVGLLLLLRIRRDRSR